MPTQPFDSQQQAITRNRALAQALLQQSFQPMEQPQIAGAKVSPLQGIAKLVQALSGSYGNHQADQQQAALDTNRNADRQRMVQALMANPNGPPTPEALASTDTTIQPIVQALLQNSMISGRERQQQAATAGLQSSSQTFQAGQNALTQQGENTRLDKQLNAPHFQFIQGEPGTPFGKFNATTGDFEQQGTRPETPKAPINDKLLDERILPNGDKVVTYQRADNTTYEKNLGKVYQPPQTGGSKADSDSYKYHIGEVAKLAKPVDEAVARIARVKDALESHTAQGDVLVPAEVMTVLAGGLGSGLRINEAEIKQVKGGRPAVDDLRAKLNKWFGTDQKSAVQFSPEQRQTLSDLVGLYEKRLLQKQTALTDAGGIISGENATGQNRKDALFNLNKTLRGIDDGSAEAAPKASGSKAPAGIPQQEWDAMTPEDRKLWK